jgi:DNA-binding MarR family transcriptional regulator
MELEKEIKQEKFKSEHHKLLVNILYTGSWIRLNNQQKLKLYGITPEQFNILRILRGQHPKPSTIQLLIERMLDKASNASRIVEKLRQKGFVQRKEAEKDRRLVDVLITAEGLDLLKKIDNAEGDFVKNISQIGEDEARLVNEILDKLRD